MQLKAYKLFDITKPVKRKIIDPDGIFLTTTIWEKFNAAYEIWQTWSWATSMGS